LARFYPSMSSLQLFLDDRRVGLLLRTLRKKLPWEVPTCPLLPSGDTFAVSRDFDLSLFFDWCFAPSDRGCDRSHPFSSLRTSDPIVLLDLLRLQSALFFKLVPLFPHVVPVASFNRLGLAAKAGTGRVPHPREPTNQKRTLLLSHGLLDPRGFFMRFPPFKDAVVFFHVNFCLVFSAVLAISLAFPRA